MIALATGTALLAVIGILVIAQELRPAPPRLDLALTRIQATHLTPGPPVPAGRGHRVGSWIADHFARPAGFLAIPRRDLALLERGAERFMCDKLVFLLAGIIIPSTLLAVMIAIGASVSWAPPVVAIVVLAVALSFVPDIRIRAQARRHRIDFRYALTCYLQLVVLELQAGAALATALEAPLSITTAWPFQRIRQALERARYSQRPPWQALAELGEGIGVHDLVDLAYTVQIAGVEGARVRDVLTAKINAMRHERTAAIRTEAATRTATMWVPTSLLMLGFVVLLGFPFFFQLLRSG